MGATRIELQPSIAFFPISLREISISTTIRDVRSYIEVTRRDKKNPFSPRVYMEIRVARAPLGKSKRA